MTLLFLCLFTAAEIPGTLIGRVVDRHANPVPFANVLVVGTNQGDRADESGRFLITPVQPGTQVLRVVAPRFEPRTDTIRVSPGPNEIVLTLDSLRVPTVVVPPERLDIGSNAEETGRDLVAEIRSVRPTYKYGDSPRFEVRIWNRGSRPVVLVKCVPGSETGASPRGEWRIAAPFDGFEHVSGAAIDGPRRGVHAGDFVEVQPGESFDPYMDGWVPATLAGGAVTRPGRFTATFRYATSNRDPRAWLERGAREMSQDVLELLARVPTVELEAKADFKVDF